MTDKPLLVAIGALSAALAACSAEIDPPEPMTTPPPATGGVIGGGGSSTGGSGGTGNVAPPNAGSPGTGGTITNPTCTPGVPSTTQIPRLKNRQYDAVVRDLLGVTATSDGRAPSAGL